MNCDHLYYIAYNDANTPVGFATYEGYFTDIKETIVKVNWIRNHTNIKEITIFTTDSLIDVNEQYVSWDFVNKHVLYSTKCSNMLKAKIVKRFMCFVGYKSDIVKDLKYMSAGYNEKYTNIYRNLKNQYKKYIESINSNTQD